jgi:hypothetical protein
MDTNIIDKIYLELAQFTKATTPRENRLQLRVTALENILVSVRAVCVRRGENTAWDALNDTLTDLGIGTITHHHYYDHPEIKELSNTENSIVKSEDCPNHRGKKCVHYRCERSNEPCEE